MSKIKFTDIREIDPETSRELIESVPFDRRAKKFRKEDMVEGLAKNLEYALSLIMSGVGVDPDPQGNAMVGIRLLSIYIRQLREAV